MLALSFICLSQNETQSEQALVAIERQRVIMPERGRIRKKPSVRQPPHAVLLTRNRVIMILKIYIGIHGSK